MTVSDDSTGETRYVSTAQVALALGVSVTTVKRWVDDDVLPAHRTAGGHRKLLLADVVRLVRAGNLPQADLSRLVPQPARRPLDADTVRRQLADAAAATDPDLIRAAIHAGYRGGLAVETLGDAVIAPVLADVGHGWATGTTTVMGEHRVTQACVSALYELRGMLRANADAGRPVAVGGAPEHDHYAIPSLLAKLTLLDAGWDAVNLGPHTPADAFLTAIRDLNPRLIWVSVSYLQDADEFLAGYREVYRLAEERGIAVAVGGRGLTPDVRTKMPYTAFGDGLTQFAAFARSLHRQPARPTRGGPKGGAASRN